MFALFLLCLRPVMAGYGGRLVQLFCSEHGTYSDREKLRANWKKVRLKSTRDHPKRASESGSWTRVHLGVLRLQICSGLSGETNSGSF